MALKDFDDVNPRTRDKNWKEDISMAEMPKLDEFYSYRIVGGIFSYGQHWIEFKNKQGEIKRYPVDCANWDANTESTSKKGNCPACEAGISMSPKYMMNVIDRAVQSKGGDPIRALEVPPTVMRQLTDLKKLNLVKGEAKSIAHPKFGIDVFLQKSRSKKRGGTEWQLQKGDRSPLTEEEMALELISFDEFYVEPDVHKIRTDLTRHGYFGDTDEKTKTRKDSNEDEDSLPSKKRPSSRDDDDDAPPPPKRKAPPAPSDDDDDAPPPPKRKAPPAPSDDDDDDAPPPKRKAPPAQSDDDDVPPKRKAPPAQSDDDDDAPPSKPKQKPKKPPVEDDDFDNDFDV